MLWKRCGVAISTFELVPAPGDGGAGGENVSTAPDDGVPGATDGLLRLCAGDAVETMQALLARLGLPPTYAQALDEAWL